MSNTTESNISSSNRFWVRVMLVTAICLVACIVTGEGDTAIALAILIHAEIKLLEHDEREHKENAEVSHK